MDTRELHSLEPLSSGVDTPAVGWKRNVGIGVALAVIIATAVVIIIFSDCRHNDVSDDCPGDWMTPGTGFVLVVTKDVQPGQSMDALIDDGHLTELQVPLESIAEGSATDISQIEGRTTRRPIRKNEQIDTQFLSHKQGPTVFAERDTLIFLEAAGPILESYKDHDVSAKEWLSRAEKELPKLRRLLDRNRDPTSWRLAGDLSSAFGLLQRALTDRVAEREERACEAVMEAHLRLTNYGNRVSVGGAVDLVPDSCSSAKSAPDA